MKTTESIKVQVDAELYEVVQEQLRPLNVTPEDFVFRCIMLMHKHREQILDGYRQGESNDMIVSWVVDQAYESLLEERT